MKTAIAIYLLIGAVGAGVRASKQEDGAGKWGYIVSIALHIWFGAWMLLNI